MSSLIFDNKKLVDGGGWGWVVFAKIKDRLEPINFKNYIPFIITNFYCHSCSRAILQLETQL